VLSWLRKYEEECCFSSGNEAWSVFHRNGRKAIPGLVRIIKARPPLFAHVVATHRWFSAHLPSWIESWAWQKDAAALDPRDRSLQNGHAWSTFLKAFPETGPGLLQVCLGLYRFTGADCPLSSILYNAAFALHVEQDCLVAPEADEGGFVARLVPPRPRAKAGSPPMPPELSS